MANRGCTTQTGQQRQRAKGWLLGLGTQAPLVQGSSQQRLLVNGYMWPLSSFNSSPFKKLWETTFKMKNTPKGLRLGMVRATCFLHMHTRVRTHIHILSSLILSS